MAGLPIKKIYDSYPLLDIFEKYNLDILPSGSGYSIVECPFCGGHDCFRVFANNTKWSCFQCDNPPKLGKDVIDFVSYMDGKPLNEVISGMLKNSGVYDFDAIDTDVQYARRLASDYFSKKLVENLDAPILVNVGGENIKKSLRYYINSVRGVSIDFALQYGLGYSKGSVCDFLSASGIDDKVILASGLYDINNSCDFFPSGAIVFPKQYNGNIVSFSSDKSPLRNLMPKKMRSKYSTGSCLFYGQSSINSGTSSIFLTEAVWDCLVVSESLKNFNPKGVVLATDGSISEQQLDWLETIDLPIIELFDADNGGKIFRNRVLSRPKIKDVYDIRPEAFDGIKDVGEYLSLKDDKVSALKNLLGKSSVPAIYKTDRVKKIKKLSNSSKSIDDFTDVSLEYSCVASCMDEDYSSISKLITVCYDSTVKSILLEILSQLENNSGVDFNIVCSNLKIKPDIKNAILSSEKTTLPVAIGRLSYLKKLRDVLAIKAKIQLLIDESASPKDLISSGSKILANLSSILYDSFTANTKYDSSDIVKKMDDIELLQGEKIDFGFSNLDSLINIGLRPKTCNIIAGRPGAGKSMTKLNFIRNQCDSGVGVLSYVPENGLMLEQLRMDSLMLSVLDTDILLCSVGDDIHKKRIKNWEYIQNNWKYFVSEGTVSVSKIVVDLLIY